MDIKCYGKDCDRAMTLKPEETNDFSITFECVDCNRKVTYDRATYYGE